MAKEDKQKFESVAWLKHYRYWIVFAFSFLLYANSIPNFYAMDDELVTTINSQSPHRLTSKGIAAIPEIFKEPYYKDARGYAYDYRPLVLTTFAIEHSLFGDNPHVSHFFNVLLYALLCVLLLKVLEVLFKNYNLLLALVATLLFAAHPVHTEVVASIKNRDEILALLFALIACWGLFKAVEFNGIKKILYTMLGFAFLFAILSKPTAIVLLPILILFVVIHNKESLLVLLVLSIVSIMLLAITQSIIFSIAQFLIMVSIVWLAVFILHIIIYKDDVMNSKWVVRYRRILMGYRKKIAEYNVQSFIAASISIKTAILIALVLILVSFILVWAGVPKGFVPIFLLAPLTYFLQWHKRFSIIHFLVFLLLFSASVLLDMFTSGLLYIGYIVTKKETKVDIWYILFSAYSALVILLFTDSQSGFVTLSIVILFAVLYKSKWAKYFVLLGSCILPTLFYFIIGDDIIPSEILVHLLIVNLMGVIVVLLAFQVSKKLQWSLVCILIFLISFSGYIPEKFNPDFNLSINASQVYQTQLPKIIEQNIYNRPITYLEAVTDALSPIEYKLGTAAQVLTKYTALLIVPYPLSFYYGYKIIDYQSGFEPLNILTLLAYVLLGIAGLIFLRKQKIIAISILVMVIGISIYTNIFLAAPGMMADRFLFVPSLGFCLLLAYAILKICKQNMGKNSAVLNWQTIAPKLKYSVLTILLAYSALTIARNNDWENELTLFTADINHLEASAQANNLYALALMKYSFNETNPTEAIKMRQTAELHFKKSITIFPKFFNSQYDLARTQSILGEYEEAEKSFVKAAKIDTSFPDAWLQAIDIAMSQHRYNDAIQYFSLMQPKYVEESPSNIYKFGYVYFLNKEYDLSIKVLKRGLSIFPNQADMNLVIGESYRALAKNDSAVFYLKKSLELNPESEQLKQLILEIKSN
ncbi:MAG: glycosyltransferase family 39 protein [Chitinophagales bacterium]|nr:glycosyltransferase family 39 protein [Chitinophagales bacterium]